MLGEHYRKDRETGGLAGCSTIVRTEKQVNMLVEQKQVDMLVEQCCKDWKQVGTLAQHCCKDRETGGDAGSALS